MKNIFLNVAVSLSIVALAYLAGRCSSDNSTATRIENERNLIEKNTIDSVNHITDVKQIQAENKKELKTVVSNNTNKALNKTATRIKDVKRINELSTETNVSMALKTEYDAIIKHDTIFVTNKHSIDYSDKWCDVAIRSIDGGMYADLKLRDSITIIARRKRKPIIWGLIKLPTKKVEVEAVNECPYTFINYAREIEMK